MTRRRGRTDANQTEVVADLRAMGVSVTSIAGVGDGCPDLLVGKWGVTTVVELKDPTKPPSRRRLTPDETAWHDAWLGSAIVAGTAEEVLDHLVALRDGRTAQ